MRKPLKKSDNLRKRVQKRRNKLRAAGLRPIQIWVPDTRKKGFAAECRRQSLLIKDSASERKFAEWWEAAADHDGCEA